VHCQSANELFVERPETILFVVLCPLAVVIGDEWLTGSVAAELNLLKLERGFFNSESC
jgi:hypothetical protein